MLYKQCGLKECKQVLDSSKGAAPSSQYSVITSARAVLSAPPKFSLAMLSVEDITPNGGYAD